MQVQGAKDGKLLTKLAEPYPPRLCCALLRVSRRPYVLAGTRHFDGSPTVARLQLIRDRLMCFVFFRKATEWEPPRPFWCFAAALLATSSTPIRHKLEAVRLVREVRRPLALLEEPLDVRLEREPVRRRRRLVEDGRLAEALGKHLAPGVVQLHAAPDVLPGLLHHVVPVDVAQQPQAESLTAAWVCKARCTRTYTHKDFMCIVCSGGYPDWFDLTWTCSL